MNTGSTVDGIRYCGWKDFDIIPSDASILLTTTRLHPVPTLPIVSIPCCLKMRALRRKAEADFAEISQRLRESEQRREELTDLKFAHEAELRELRGRSEAGEAGREAASNDAKALREANRALEARVFEAEREAERLRLQAAALSQQV